MENNNQRKWKKGGRKPKLDPAVYFIGILKIYNELF